MRSVAGALPPMRTELFCSYLCAAPKAIKGIDTDHLMFEFATSDLIETLLVVIDDRAHRRCPCASEICRGADSISALAAWQRFVLEAAARRAFRLLDRKCGVWYTQISPRNAAIARLEVTVR
jgi:hypothetical protein